jgi:hypothetical protein
VNKGKANGEITRTGGDGLWMWMAGCGRSGIGGHGWSGVERETLCFPKSLEPFEKILLWKIQADPMLLI